MNTHLLLSDVARLLNIKQYRITYALETGLVAEPRLRIARNRVFLPDDVKRVADHFGVQVPKEEQ